MTASLLVFAKAPEPGLVKTRLAASVGAAAAADLYRVLAERVLAQTAPMGAEYVRVVVADGIDAARSWFPGEVCVPQAPGDLGARMAAAAAWAFGRGDERVVLVGTDVPGLGRAHVRAALQALDQHDLVLGPAMDGGYYLIALRRPQPELFEGIAWSTRAVFEATLARARRLGLRVTRLSSLGDIDTLEDLEREWPRMQAWMPPLLRSSLKTALE
jgi:rSAM/selenodomain-associated transferase 1